MNTDLKYLLLYLDQVVLPIMDKQPSPRLGDWNWPDIAKRLRDRMERVRNSEEKEA